MQETRRELRIPADVAERYDKLMDPPGGELDYDKNDIPRYACLERWTVRFDGSYEADVKVCSGDSSQKDPLWSEAVLFLDGRQVCCTDAGDQIAGEYELEHDGNRFVVDVIASKGEESE